jgi:hypothetical protein
MGSSGRSFLSDNVWASARLVLVLLCGIGIAAAYFTLGWSGRGARAGAALTLPPPKALQGSDIVSLQKLNRAYERIAQATTPAIVSIQSTQVVKVPLSPFLADPFRRPTWR